MITEILSIWLIKSPLIVNRVNRCLRYWKVASTHKLQNTALYKDFQRNHVVCFLNFEKITIMLQLGKNQESFCKDYPNFNDKTCLTKLEKNQFENWEKFLRILWFTDSLTLTLIDPIGLIPVWNLPTIRSFHQFRRLIEVRCVAVELVCVWG